MEQSRQKPNILLLMTDQQRFDALSCHDGWIETPNLDALASCGTDLQQHFSQAPVCVPSRSSIFSGRYGHAHQVLENDSRLSAGEAHLFKVLKTAGYKLGYFGKNHLLPNAEMQANFDRFDDCSGADASPERIAYKKLERASLERLGSIGSFASSEFHDFPDEVTTTGMITDNALEFIKSAPSNQSWCGVVSYYDPHVPHLAPRRFEAQYPLELIPVPEHDPAELEQKAPRSMVKYIAQNAHLASDHDKRMYLAVYAGMCSYVDEQMGRILSTLAERPDASNTIVVFISDHGDFAWHHGLCKKDLVMYDDLIHVPAIISWPGLVKSGPVTETFTEHVDLMPTLLELTGIPVPFGCQGKSMAALLHGATTTHKEEIHAEVCYPWMRFEFKDIESYDKAWQAARGEDTPLGRSANYNIPGDYTKCVRTKEWKFIWYGNGFEELYDLEADPGERNNLSGNAQYSTVQADLRSRLFRWLTETSDPNSPRSESENIASFSEWDSCVNVPRC